ncbi:MAG: DNA polymerase Y family protein [Rhodospirillaceae bacterium]|nr:DNA polymerase Y family protein [Rhodospirillales bacterium]MBT4700911.1 DNA polymerase Y family protein [Rhodospirillaceae bacterium]MBT5034106.1 DNA polymerase Y family protein [Rhodospirillaceae bacterium]MBT6220998.1 DNA polymerase Y family protein [Rhodospirillaceae bacterium]MBT6360884.1 DNA polymerase Y family protein [Rhodospirillaceae bacterium]
MKRRIISIWFPRLATDRIARRDPSLRTNTPLDIPMAVTREAQGRLFVVNTNQTAEQSGVHIGMTLADARAVLPGLVTRADDIPANAKLLRRLARWCHRFTPHVGIDDEQGLWLDISGCAHLLGGERSLLNKLIAGAERLGFQTRAALAGTPGAAWALCHFGSNGSIVPPEYEKKALTPLPVRALRLPTKTIAELDRLGLRRIGDLMPLPRAAITARFRDHLIARLDQALGHRPEAISPLPQKKPYRTRLAFPEPIAHRAGIEGALERLLAALCTRFKKEARGCRRLELTIHRVDSTTQTEAIGTATAAHDPDHLARLFQENLGNFNPGFGIEAMVLSAPLTERIEAQQRTLTPSRNDHAHNAHAQLIDRLSNRLGTHNVYAMAPFESHQPGRSQQKTRRPSPHSWPILPPRPLRLLRPPQPINAVAVPGFITPPTHFHWSRRDHLIRRAEGPERIAPEWWRGREMETRDYWRVEDATGQRFWLYQDAAQRWFLHGLFS